MKKKLTYRFSILVLCCLQFGYLFTQDTIPPYEYDQEDVIDARDGIDYSDEVLDRRESEINYKYDQEDLTEARDGIDYSDEVLDKKERKKKSSGSYNPDFSGFGNLFGFLLIGLLIALVFIILYFMLGNDNMFKPKSKKIEALDLKSIEQIEENLEEYDVAYYLKQAIENRQYRIAIRLHYLLIIKELSTKKFIKWKRDKTNRSYIYETVDYPFANNFKRSTSIFEKVWYGERDVTEGDFSMIHSHFNSLNQEINRLSNE